MSTRMVTTVELDRLHERLADEGLCATAGPDDARWMPDVRPPMTPERACELRLAARLACAGCPVMAECLTWALETRQEYGTWGGRAEHEIAELRTGAVMAYEDALALLATAAADPAETGTEAVAA